ncbi:MAG TPA: DUF4231 domain-containing protein [Propionibacteriaceae bacterium]
MVAALVARFPTWRAPRRSPPVISPAVRERYPELEADFDVLAREVGGAFRDFDLQALREQNRYRRQHVVIVLGSALMTGLGGLQAVVPGQRWPGLVLAALGIILAASSRWAREHASQSAYLTARIKAERLRALHFRYLSRTGRFAGEGRDLEVRRAVLAIRAGRELE